MEIWVPYGSTEVCLTVKSENLLGVISPNPRPPTVEPLEEAKKALENPVNSLRLKDLVKPENRVAIAVDKNMNRRFSAPVVSQLCSELNEGKLENSNITVILGNGLGEAPAIEEAEKLLEVIPRDVQVRVNNPHKDEELIEVGTTSYKTKVYLNKNFVQADFRIILGDVVLHPYAGYSGGRQTILAVSGIKTIHHNYNLSINPDCRMGVLEENPIHLDMVEAAKIGKVDFTFNIITNQDGEMYRAFCGDLENTFMEAVKFVESIYGVKVEAKSDIGVVSPGGEPFDSDLYRAQESLDHAVRVVKDGGVIVLVAECSQGYGDQKFYRWMIDFGAVDEVKEFMKKKFVYGIHKTVRLMDYMDKFRIIMVTVLPETIAKGVFKFKTAKRLDDAMEMALELTGRKAKILVVPYATKILPMPNSKESQHSKQA